ncbi:MAG: dihydroorotate dehydrogenase [Saccharofermentanales bacterium]|jgi:dihydroorotate dehydrogenase (NAD+) catalytic subunit
MNQVNSPGTSKQVKTEVTVGNVRLKNPVLAASGTFGFGAELAPYYDLSCLGGICTKGLTLQPRIGNPPPRVAETKSGMLNAVGLQNPGVDVFVTEILPEMLTYDTAIIVNVAGNSKEDYVEMVRILSATEVTALELNLSCPNVSAGCMSIGAEPEQVWEVVASCRAVTDKPLWVKLTPNVTSISAVARAAEEAGADALVLINTLLGMAVNLKTERPVLRNNTGGLSGPAIKPVALRMVYEAHRDTNLPIVGLGGIAAAEDALEFMLCGASAVQVGTAAMIDPDLIFRLPAEMAAIAGAAGHDNLARYTGQLLPW